jgi:molybdenum cofactor cytidylyltransferase
MLKIVVLAAGFSRRLGTPKALARIHGVSLLRLTIERLTVLSPSPIIVVVPPRSNRYRVELRRQRALQAENPQRSSGLASSVRTGIRKAMYCPGILLIPVDLPRLRGREIQRLIERWRSAPRRVAARRIGTEGATPLILPRRLFRAALKIQGDVGLRDLIRHLPPDQRTLVDLASAETDVDTPVDLRNARRRMGPREYSTKGL